MFIVKAWVLNDIKNINEPDYDKANKMTSASSKDSDLPGHLAQSDQSSLSAWRKFGSFVTHKEHIEDSSDWTDDLSLRWGHRSFCLFCHAPTELLYVN